MALLNSLTLASPGTFDQASIDQTYNDLIVVLMVRGTNAATNDNIDIKFNNDGGANYTWDIATVVNTTLSASVTAGSAVGSIAKASSAGGTANVFTPVVIVIPGYTSTSWFKVALSQYGVAYTALAANTTTGTGMLQWASTAAINRISVQGDNTANLATGSTMRIYGRL